MPQGLGFFGWTEGGDIFAVVCCLDLGTVYAWIFSFLSHLTAFYLIIIDVSRENCLVP